MAKGVGTWTRRRQGLGLGGEAWWVGGEALKAQALVAPKQAWRGNQHHHQPCPPSHNHTQHTQQKSEGQATKHNGGVWLVKPSLAFPSTLQQQQEEEEEEERTEGWGRGTGRKEAGPRPAGVGGGGVMATGGTTLTNSLKRRKHCAHPPSPSPTLTHRQEKDRDKEKDRTRQRTRSGRWVWLCMKRRRKQVGWWVTTSHKSTQGKAKQPSLTPFLSSTPPFPLPFSPFFLSIPSPLYIMDYTRLKLKNTLNSFSLFSLSKHTNTKKEKQNERTIG